MTRFRECPWVFTLMKLLNINAGDKLPNYKALSIQLHKS